MKPVLKCEKLFVLLNQLGINNFEGSRLLGYHHDKNVLEIKEQAEQQNLFTNFISDDEIIVSSNPIWLGKEYIDHQNDFYTITYHSKDEWNNLKRIYDVIKQTPAVPEMTFSKEKVVVVKEFKGEELLKFNKVSSIHKIKFVNFLKEMNRLGYAHRDLHCKNIILSQHDLKVIDWDFVIEERCDIINSYDLTGTGLPSPHQTNRCHIFKSFPNLNAPSVAELLNITMEDLWKSP